MNKYEDQKVTGLKRVSERYKEKYPNDFTGQTYLENQIERATPKKVIRTKYAELGTKHSCPKCGVGVDSICEVNFCDDCGQTLDWSDEK